MNANDGSGEIECDDFLSPARLGPYERGPYSLTVHGDIMSVAASVDSPDDVIKLGYLVEYTIAPLLSVHNSVYVSVDELTGSIGETVAIRLELGQFGHAMAISTNDHRKACVEAALQPLPVGSERLIVSCIYFQHAERLGSGSETRIPYLNASEIVLNLAKCLQVLFGESRTSIREGCRSFGLTEAETEQAIIPILLFRDTLDGAHATITPASQEMLETMREFVGRATHNTRALLVRVQAKLSRGEAQIRAIEPDPARQAERSKLVDRMREYLAVDGLSKEP
jgi:hypothetical protein